MAFRDVRTAGVLTVALLLPVGCGGTAEDTGEDEDYVGLPHDTVTLSADDLARLPWYGVQRLPCDTVTQYLTRSGIDTATTDTIRLSLSGDSLVATPHIAVAGTGDEIRIRSDSLVWVANFKEMSPFRDTTRVARGGPGMTAATETASATGGGELTVASDSTTCGRYYYSVAAYHPRRADTVYVADPPMWIRY